MKGGNGTHWEDCYKSHIDCAEVLIDKQKDRIAALEAALMVAEDALEDVQYQEGWLPDSGKKALAQIAALKGKEGE